ncbi:MAG: DJ-1/PfpI family protein [Candidatus Aenigmarchaeota archaeon]|nr:DJ-1/PfpI family protein [Candidatus Aenigmarchaeota archaeon]MCK4531951.1 DJ-1/PfpI family protein [Candidatus Aenigmarchaeota archaeon]
MKRVLIPLAEGFEEIEALATADVLRRADLEVVLAGIPGTIVKGRSGIKIVADTKIEDVNHKDFDCIVLPGGNPGYINLERSKKVFDIINDFNDQEKLIAAICAAPSILGKMGILDNRRATIYPGMEKDIPRPRSGKVVVDDHVITSEGPGTALDFALEIIKNLLGKGKANEVKKEIVYR